MLCRFNNAYCFKAASQKMQGFCIVIFAVIRGGTNILLYLYKAQFKTTES